MFRKLLQLLCWTLPILLWDGVRLGCFVLCLFPGFFRFAWYYWVASNRASIRYGTASCRQTLDVYSLKPSTAEYQDQSLLGSPVVLFVCGGAWVIGYKMWGSLLARALTAAGIIVVIPDVRNYPWGSVPGMVEDVEASLDWTRRNISEYGGDPESIVLVGQSAGGHLACTAILRRATQLMLSAENNNSTMNPMEHLESDDSKEEEEEGNWDPRTSIKGFFSLSAPFNLELMQTTFSGHGLDSGIVDRIFGNEKEEYDPYQIVQRCRQEGIDLSDYLPPIMLYHGSSDKTVPYESSEELYNELQHIVSPVHPIDFSLYEKWSHTDPILEGPMDADHRFHKDIFVAVRDWTESQDLEWPEDHPAIKSRLCPRFLIQAGRICNPF